MFPPLVLQMMEVGEETGELPKLLDDVAAHYAREVDYALKTLSAAIEPILIVCVGGMVLVLALGRVPAHVGHDRQGRRRLTAAAPRDRSSGNARSLNCELRTNPSSAAVDGHFVMRYDYKNPFGAHP